MSQYTASYTHNISTRKPHPIAQFSFGSARYSPGHKRNVQRAKILLFHLTCHRRGGLHSGGLLSPATDFGSGRAHSGGLHSGGLRVDPSHHPPTGCRFCIFGLPAIHKSTGTLQSGPYGLDPQPRTTDFGAGWFFAKDVIISLHKSNPTVRTTDFGAGGPLTCS